MDINGNRILYQLEKNYEKGGTKMIKIFYSSAYKVKHENINEENALAMLQSDIRSKIIGDTKQFVYGSDGVILKNNPNVLYLGGFYYEQPKFENCKYGECENTVKNELAQIDEADMVLISLLQYSAIATITELLYASFKKKKTIVFCSKNITQFKTEYEYWFPLITGMTINQDITIKYVKTEDEIVSYINNLKEDKVGK